MSPLFWIIGAFICIAAAMLLLRVGARRQEETGLPPGRVIYSDPKILGAPEKPFYDAELRLTGKPDYLVAEGESVVPVEIKSSWAPSEPHAGHIFQLMAYCLLVERAFGKRPPYGILRYRNRSFAIEYTTAAEHDLLRLLDEIHASGAGKEQARSHDEPARCAHCGYRSICEQRL